MAYPLRQIDVDQSPQAFILEHAADALELMAKSIRAGHPYHMKERLIYALASLEAGLPGSVPTLLEQLEGIYPAEIERCRSASDALRVANELQPLYASVSQLWDVALRKADRL